MNAKDAFTNFFRGTISRKTMLTKLVPVIGAVFLIGFFIANLVFPEPYDWRYMVISDLVGPETNPLGYIFPTVGLVTGSILMIPFLGYYQKKLGKICRGSTGVGSFFMFVGIVSFIGMGTIAQFGLVDRLHEYLAGVGFVGVIFSGLFYSCPILKDHSKGAKQFNMRLLAVMLVMLVVPVVGLGLSSLYGELMHMPWINNPDIEKFELYRFPAWVSFAFWEWMMFVGVVVYIFTFVIMVPEEVKPFVKPIKKQR
nr:DUF998 domain-containing protein [Candidatus Sigynarchaeota archaeon]